MKKNNPQVTRAEVFLCYVVDLKTKTFLPEYNLPLVKLTFFQTFYNKPDGFCKESPHLVKQ